MPLSSQYATVIRQFRSYLPCQDGNYTEYFYQVFQHILLLPIFQIIILMPNLDNAKKAIRVSEKKRIINDRRRKTMRTSIKTVKVSMTATDLSKAYQAIDKAVKRGVIKKNTGARKKSRLTLAIKKATTK